MMYGIRFIYVAVALAVGAAPAAHAQWAVVDVQSITQLVKQIQLMEQELQTARGQLLQAQNALKTMTGDRGMQFLLAGITRNYLPTTAAQLSSLMQGGDGGFPSLAAAVRGSMAGNAVLSASQLAALAPGVQRAVLAARRTGALQQAVAQEALANASGRFTAIQNLIAAIPAAADQKGILDLQARISAELGMLQNEQTKLQILTQTLQAQDAVNQAQLREQVIAAQGEFATRFQPVP